MRPGLLGSVTVLLAIATPSLAAAEAAPPIYVSERFQVVSRRLATEISFSALESVCPKSSAAFCKPVVKVLVAAFRAAVDGDTKAVELALRSFFLELAGNIAVDSLIGELRGSLDPGVAEGVAAISPCLAGTVTASAECVLARADLTCGQEAVHDADTALCWLESRVAGTAESPGERADLVLYIQQLRTLVRGGFDDGVFEAVRTFFAGRELLLVEREVLDLAVAPKARGLWGGPANAELARDCPPYQAWFGLRAAQLGDFRRALVAGAPLKLDALDALAMNDCAAEKAKDVRRYARYASGPLAFSSFARKWSVLLFGGAALIDYARDGDEGRFADAVYATVEDLVAEQVAAGLREEHFSTQGELTNVEHISSLDVLQSCEMLEARALLGKRFRVAEDKSCYSLSSRGVSTIATDAAVAADPSPGFAESIAKEAVELIALVSLDRGLDERHVFGALLQAPVDPQLTALIQTLDKRPADLDARRRLRVLALSLIPALAPPPVEGTSSALIARWTAGLENSHRWYAPSGDMTERVESRLRAVVTLARRLAASKWRDRVKSSDLSLVLAAVESTLQGQVKDLETVLRRVAVKVISGELQLRAKHLLGISEETGCDDDRHRFLFAGIFSDACAAGMLIDASIAPVVEYFASTDRDAAALVQELHKTALRSPALDRSPFIANVGLGYTHVTFPQAGTDNFGAMTLLDKLGLAVYKYLDDRWQIEMGIFVGGFFDALIRTLADDDERYWLAGATVGLPRMFGLPVGIEGHIGAALPFSADGQDVGIGIGGTVIVPWSIVFDQEE